MTATNLKKVRVISGTGATGIQQVVILTGLTGPTGGIPQYTQLSGFTGPTGTFKTLQNRTDTGPTGTFKKVIIDGYSAPA